MINTDHLKGRKSWEKCEITIAGTKQATDVLIDEQLSEWWCKSNNWNISAPIFRTQHEPKSSNSNRATSVTIPKIKAGTNREMKDEVGDLFYKNKLNQLSFGYIIHSFLAMQHKAAVWH